jgi:threonine/homoserine/homoserine lactone efflux protein
MDSVSHFQHLGLFALVVLGIMVLPGLDIALILGKTLTEGRPSGAAATAGVMLGGAVHVLVAMLGLGLLLQGVLMGAIVVGTQALVYGGLVVGAGGLRLALSRHPARQKRMAQVVGVLLMASALWTAWSGWHQAVAP